MKKRLVAVAAAAIVVVAVASVLLYVNFTKPGKKPPTNIEHVGGRYDATISSWTGQDYAELNYTDETGTHSGKYFSLKMRECLDWIRTNTPENATFLSWWDYGHEIKGYAERNVVVRNPSQENIDMVADRSSVTEFDPNERVVDVAKAFAASDSTETLQIVRKYNVTHILVSSDNPGILWWIYHIAGLEPTNYLVSQNSTWILNDLGKQTMVARLLDNRDTPFTLIYDYQGIKVYKTD